MDIQEALGDVDVAQMLEALEDDAGPTPTPQPDPAAMGPPHFTASAVYTPEELVEMLTTTAACSVHISDRDDLEWMLAAAKRVVEAIRARIDTQADTTMNEEILNFPITAMTILGSHKGPIAEGHIAQLIVDGAMAGERLKEYFVLLRGFHGNAEIFMRAALRMLPDMRLPVVGILTEPGTSCTYEMAISDMQTYVASIQWKIQAIKDIDRRVSDPEFEKQMTTLHVRHITRQRQSSMADSPDEVVDEYLAATPHRKYVAIGDAGVHREYLVLIGKIYHMFGTLALVDPHWSPATACTPEKFLVLATDTRETLLRRPLEERRGLVEQEHVHRGFLRDLMCRVGGDLAPRMVEELEGFWQTYPCALLQ
uniref:HNH nuclease domain-containing protein n=1 Tax=Mycena chlorophos TaxID=658473 RepID=A0ABQ0KVS0_MYCCL|nr:predicted protein [Mycena chlorophos]